MGFIKAKARKENKGGVVNRQTKEKKRGGGWSLDKPKMDKYQEGGL